MSLFESTLALLAFAVALLHLARRFLVERRQRGQIFDDTYHRLEDELDRVEVQAAPLESTLLDG